MWRLFRKTKPPLAETYKSSWNEQKFDYESRRGPKTEINCADDGQQKFTRTEVRVVREKCIVMSPVGSRTENNTADEGQQEFARAEFRAVREQYMVTGPAGPPTKNDCGVSS
jgi:formylglycine-generating enzyme required for sulfatase activity